MSALDKEYIIPFEGLKLGTHEFEFKITDAFFESFEYSLIQAGNLDVTLSLEKKETMMIGNFAAEGTINTTCDRCSDPLELPVSGKFQLIYKFDDQESDDEALIIVYPNQFDIDVKGNILELITVSLPSRMIHNEGECNEEMVELLDEYSSGYIEEEEDDEEDVSDPRWDALKKLKGNE